MTAAKRWMRQRYCWLDIERRRSSASTLWAEGDGPGRAFCCCTCRACWRCLLSLPHPPGTAARTTLLHLSSWLSHGLLPFLLHHHLSTRRCPQPSSCPILRPQLLRDKQCSRPGDPRVTRGMTHDTGRGSASELCHGRLRQADLRSNAEAISQRQRQQWRRQRQRQRPQRQRGSTLAWLILFITCMMHFYFSCCCCSGALGCSK